jgi:hypothetical protein
MFYSGLAAIERIGRDCRRMACYRKFYRFFQAVSPGF